jgi:hypothetical protein
MKTPLPFISNSFGGQSKVGAEKKPAGRGVRSITAPNPRQAENFRLSLAHDLSGLISK